MRDRKTTRQQNSRTRRQRTGQQETEEQRPVGQQSRDNTTAGQRTAKEHDSRTGKQQNSTTAGQEEQISRTGKQQNSTTAEQQESKKVEAKSNRKTRKRRQQDSRTAEQQEKRTATEQNSRRVKLVWPVSRRLLPEPAFWLAPLMHFGFALRRLSACALRFARFVPLRARACLALFCRGRCDLLASYPFVLPPAWRLFCRLPPCSLRLVSCRFILVPAWWLGFAAVCLRVWFACFVPLRGFYLLGGLAFCRLPACTLQSGSFRAVSCLYLLRGSLFAAYVSVLCGSAGFAPLRACACFFASSGSCRAVSRLYLFACFLFPACLPASWLGWFRPASCFYLLRGWFLALACLTLSVVGGSARSCRLVLAPALWLVLGRLACLCFVAWLVPCRFVLVLVSWLGFAACLPVALRLGLLLSRVRGKEERRKRKKRGEERMGEGIFQRRVRLGSN